MPKLSAVIITKNEERNIGRCIDSLEGVADEIIVVDSGSTDRTEEICKEKKVSFLFNEWKGYIEQKNYANGQTRYQYILSLDADEALSDQLRASILKAKENFQSDAYEMNRLTNYCGKWIRHCGWYPDRKTRLFDKEKFEWGGERIHENLVPRSKDVSLERLAGDILHYSYYDIAQHIAQANLFTTMTAELAIEKGKNAGLIKVFCSPMVKFIRDYFLKLGFLDGYYGYVVCRISAQATFMKYAKMRQMKRAAKA